MNMKGVNKVSVITATHQQASSKSKNQKLKYDLLWPNSPPYMSCDKFK